MTHDDQRRARRARGSLSGADKGRGAVVRSFCTISCAALLAYPLNAVGQSADVSATFEVASVKPTPLDQQNHLRTDLCLAGSRFAVAGTPVMWSLAYAYRLKDFQIVGAPPWLNGFDSAYDIEGRTPGPVSNERCRLMVQSLFVDRFKLKAHREMKEAAAYLLIIGRNGTKLRQGGGVKLNGSVEVGAAGKPVWGGDGITMAALAGILSNYTDRPVVDRTGLTRTYGVTLDFSRADGDERPSIFTAVQEQLGLKLEAGKALIEMLVIDHIEKPSEN